MGILASVILMPTFDHGAKGSRVTPRCTSAFARSLRRVFNVFVLCLKQAGRRRKEGQRVVNRIELARKDTWFAVSVKFSLVVAVLESFSVC
jgi:hypothetical protein